MQSTFVAANVKNQNHFREHVSSHTAKRSMPIAQVGTYIYSSEDICLAINTYVFKDNDILT